MSIDGHIQPQLHRQYTAGLSSAMEQLGPYRSTETFASPLHCAPSSQVPPIAKAPTVAARYKMLKNEICQKVPIFEAILLS